MVRIFLAQVKICGWSSDVVVLSSRTRFMLSDGSGTIEVVDDTAGSDSGTLPEHVAFLNKDRALVSVIGSVIVGDAPDTKLTFIATHARAVQSPIEYAMYHDAAVCMAAIRYRKLSSASNISSGVAAGLNSAEDIQRLPKPSDVEHITDDMQLSVLKILNTKAKKQMNREQLTKLLETHFKGADVDEALGKLIDNGEVVAYQGDILIA
eukprot:GHVT01000535.1.p1 GENE.GHVT01000535.1~~GHVT01000535.1.p1  ORF type:complete len:208 (+),score=12.91 GHVT01000535.1:709-1332(+)